MKFELGIFIFLLFLVQNTYSQEPTTSKIDSIILNLESVEQDKPKEKAIIPLLNILDKGLHHFIDKTYKFIGEQKYAHTVIRSNRRIHIKYLLNKNEALNILEKENKLDLKKMDSLLVEDENKYIQEKLLTNDSFDNMFFFSYDIYPDSLFLQDSFLINPFSINSFLIDNHFIFYAGKMNIVLNQIKAKLNKQEIEKIDKYLLQNYNGFSSIENEFRPEPVGIRYIAIGKNNTHYAGVDIYGRHYLFTIDLVLNQITQILSLWVY